MTPPPPGWKHPQYDPPHDWQRVLVLLSHGATAGPLVYRHPLMWTLPPLMGPVPWEIVGWQPVEEEPK